MVLLDGMRLFSVPAALIGASEQFFRRPLQMSAQPWRPLGMRQTFWPCCSKEATARSQDELRRFSRAGQEGIADDIVRTMEKAGYTVRETDPLLTRLPPCSRRASRRRMSTACG
jgi:hypothetical protein